LLLLLLLLCLLWSPVADCNGNWNTTITNPATIGYGTAEVPYLAHANCVANASDPYKGSYTQAIGQVGVWVELL
jgi:hypothetical protein